MIRLEQAKEAKKKAMTMPEFAGSSVNGIGIARIGENFAVAVSFVGGKPSEELPDRINGVEVVYRYNVGKRVAL